MEDGDLALMRDGTVWAWGSNTFGELGNDSVADGRLPVQVQHLTDVISISAGLDYNLVLKRDGTIWAWGDNSDHQLGNESNIKYSYSPVQVKGLIDAVAMAASFDHFSLALKKDGTVWAWGTAENGFVKSSTAIKAKGLNDIKAIAAPNFENIALKKDGTVWAWGGDEMDPLEEMEKNTSRSSEEIPVHNFSPHPISGLNNVMAIAGGGANGLALKNDGTVWAWGPGPLGKGQIGNLKDVTAIEGGNETALLLNKDGVAWAWGSNVEGKLGDGSRNDSKTPIQVKNLTDLIDVSAGAHHCLALKKDGTVWAWGNNQYGQLGDGTNNDTNIPVQVKGLPIQSTSIAAPGTTLVTQSSQAQTSTGNTPSSSSFPLNFSVAEQLKKKPDEVIQKKISLPKFRKETQDLDRLFTTFRWIPFFQKGAPLGYKFLDIQTGSLFEELGFQKEDVLLAVNDKAMTLDGKKIFGDHQTKINNLNYLIYRVEKFVRIEISF
jgi:alpha-tubulin suppressor-like RCC1 family protein